MEGRRRVLRGGILYFEMIYYVNFHCRKSCVQFVISNLRPKLRLSIFFMSLSVEPNV